MTAPSTTRIKQCLQLLNATIKASLSCLKDGTSGEDQVEQTSIQAAMRIGTIPLCQENSYMVVVDIDFRPHCQSWTQLGGGARAARRYTQSEQLARYANTDRKDAETDGVSRKRQR
jgi:hypothetical protein